MCFTNVLIGTKKQTKRTPNNPSHTPLTKSNPVELMGRGGEKQKRWMMIFLSETMSALIYCAEKICVKLEGFLLKAVSVDVNVCK